MAKKVITGIREYDFEDEKTGREVSGLSVYYVNELFSENGLVAKGYTCGKISVKKGTPLYKKMLNADYSKVLEAEFKFDFDPQRNKPVLLDIDFAK